MGRPSLLFITLTVIISSLGSLIQASQPPDSSDLVQTAAGTDRNSSSLNFTSEGSVEGSGLGAGSVASQKIFNKSVILKEPEQLSNEKHSASGITLTTGPANTVQHSGTHNQEADKANTSIRTYTHPSVHIISEEVQLEGSHITEEEELKESRMSTVQDDFLTGGDSPKFPVQTSVFPSVVHYNLSQPGGPCGIQPCVVSKNFNGTSLLWDDMRRTLAFAWELHVFGSASLFTLMTVLAGVGMVGACILPHPLCEALILANSLLIMGGSLRTVLLLLDPYGTCQILSHATLAALHNVPLQLLLWAQVVLALVTLRGLKVTPFSLKLQCPWVVGGFSILHCTALLVADLYSSTLPPALPLLLQTFSLCLGLPFCLGILTKTFSHLHSFPRTSVPLWVPSQKTEKRGKRVTAVCAFLGGLCCILQVYSLFWLYGLLGNWRQFGWGWWLSQFWARILELAWGFSLVVLGSWIFWTPSRVPSRSDHVQGRGEVSKRVEPKSLWGRVLATVWKGPLRKPEKTWENLMPNNWGKFNLSTAGFINSAMCPYDEPPSAILQEYKQDPVSSSSSDSQAAFMWQKVGERECVLSLIEFDMRPPSPINLRRSIDNALYHGQLVAGSLFTPPPPSWTQTMGIDSHDCDSSTTGFPPAYVGYGWMLDTESISASLDHFQAKEPEQPASADCDGSTGSPAAAHHREKFSAVMHQHYWSDDDVTDL